MGGGTMQLIAYGEQDVYLTTNPQITYFKVVYKRLTSFAMQPINYQFIGVPEFGGTSSVIISKDYDLLHKMYLRLILPEVIPSDEKSKFAWVRKIGNALIQSVNIDIGGTIIDRQYSDWLNIWWELFRNPKSNVDGYLSMIGDVDELIEYSNEKKKEYELFVPLQFWFNRNTGLSIPLIALQYHQVTMTVAFRKREELIICNDYFMKNDVSQIFIKDAFLLTDVIYLDNYERKRFAKVNHEYLIEQVQFNGEELVLHDNPIYHLDFNHPTKEILWCIKNGNYTSGNYFIGYNHTDNWDNWEQTAVDSTLKLLEQSHIFALSSNLPVLSNNWIMVNPGEVITVNNWTIINKSDDTTVFYNYMSLISPNGVSLLSQIYGILTLNSGNIINDLSKNIIYDIVKYLSIRDISLPTNCCEDTRSRTSFFMEIIPGEGNDPDITNIIPGSLQIPDDIIVYQWHNCGILIDGSFNPVKNALIQYNGHDRFDTREGAYFNYVQPEQHHTNIPPDGINVYSFCLFPEKHQPSGTSNLSKIDTTDLILWIDDITFEPGLIDINFFNAENRISIFGFSYNILRIMNGLGGLAYKI